MVFFVLGIDAFLEIDTWKEHENVLKQCHFVVVSRPGYDLGSAKETLGEKYQERIVEISESASVEEGIHASFKMFLFPMESLDIASTEIRRRIREGESIKGMVPETVETYIQENNLYREKNG